jgi:orotate phosphoribosyltransferase
VAIFTYDFPLAEENFKEAACPFYTLSNYETLIEQALNLNYINKEDMKSLKKWKENPSEWKNA